MHLERFALRTKVTQGKGTTILLDLKAISAFGPSSQPNPRFIQVYYQTLHCIG